MPAAPSSVIRHLLFALPPETAHQLALTALQARALCSHAQPPTVMPRQVMGLNFPNPLGLAAGFDKDGAYTDALTTLGFGFLEVGAITPQPQAGTAKPRIFRLPTASALINRMGFNNCGAKKAAGHLRQRRQASIIGINIGKNANTPPRQAADDYAQCLQMLYDVGDFFTVNVSSPNTPGLRDLQEKDTLHRLLDAVISKRDNLAAAYGQRKPIAVKLSADLDDDALAAAAEAIAAAGADGVIAVNTTTTRPPFLQHLPAAKESGGLSGRPLAARATAMLRALRQLLPKETALIGVGGIFSGADAHEKLSAGADLVQIYTGLIYEGPALPRRILAYLQNQVDG